MIRRKHVLVLALGLVAALADSVAGDDAKTPPKDKPDFTKAGYVFVKEMPGEVVSADDKKVKLKVAFLAPGKPVKGRATTTTKTQEYEYEFVPDISLVRYETKGLLPKKTDEKGKKVEYTQKELDKLKLPIGVTGYAASPSDIAPKATVTLRLYAEKSLYNKGMATETDYKIGYAIVNSLPTTPMPNK